MIHRVLDLFYGRSIRCQTKAYLNELATAPIRASRRQAEELLHSLASTASPTVTLGTSVWGQKVSVPVSDLVTSHGLITGGTGSGKTRYTLLLVEAIMAQYPGNTEMGIGIVDPKGELFVGAVVLLARRLAQLDYDDPDAACELRKRVVIIDFSSTDPISPFNILARSSNTEPGFFADSRADLMADLLPSGDHLSINGAAVLSKVIRLLTECSVPITMMDDVLHDEALRDRMLQQSKDPALLKYFSRQFPSVPKQTVAALSRRVAALFSSESVRCSLSATTAPDFATLQDNARLILIHCAGANLSRAVRQLLQALILSDIRHSVFARRRTDRPFVWMLDEAQTFFLNERLRDHVADLVTQARSFGSRFHFLTQNITTAVQDTRLLANIVTNTAWTFSMRGQPSDCVFLKSAIPTTSRRPKPQTNPFEPPDFFTTSEERAIEHDAVASLPDRVGYLWLRSKSPEAFKITTQDLALPIGEDLQCMIAPILSDCRLGSRLSRLDYEREIGLCRNPPTRDGAEPPTDFEARLAGTYKRRRSQRE